MRTERRIQMASAALLVAAVSGCSHGNTIWTAPALGQDKNTWVGTTPSDAMLVQLTRNGNALSGSVDESALPNGTQDQAKVHQDHVGFTGTADGTSITLKLELGLGSSTSLSGTLTSEKLTLNYPSGNGTIQTIEFKPSTLAAYNKASADLQARIDAAVAQQQQDAAQAAQQQADAQNASDIDSAAQTVSLDYDNLKNAMGGKADFSAFDSDLNLARNSLKEVEAHAATATSTGHDASGNGCIAASDAVNSAADVQNDASSIQTDISTMSDTTAGWRNFAETLKADYQKFNDAQALRPDYSSMPSLPASTMISGLVSDAGTRADQNDARANGYLTEVNALVDKANKTGESATAASC